MAYFVELVRSNEIYEEHVVDFFSCSARQWLAVVSSTDEAAEALEQESAN